ncbi:TetR/AcrR family transcriptional regulator [Actinoalloteichus caeruleus]|uniref:TetR/AcrR family transcriptional regulator n=1 Tax=Actinoalloteichus cyanogriseus TaxID=2893586 RepID=UPI00200D6D6A|nr:TetR/AcrR family transcriptional regulator [Actinoalloteichus caeruleus]
MSAGFPGSAASEVADPAQDHADGDLPTPGAGRASPPLAARVSEPRTGAGSETPARDGAVDGGSPEDGAEVGRDGQPTMATDTGVAVAETPPGEQPRARRGRRAVTPATRTRQPTEVRRRLVLEAALPLIGERGLAGIGIRDIARAAGVSVGTVTYHFHSVREILSEAIALEIEQYYDPVLAEARRSRSAVEGLRGLVEAAFTEDTARHWRLWFDYWSAGRHDDAFADRQSGRYDRWHAQILELIRRGVAEGEFGCPDPEESAVHLVALIDGLALQRLRQAPPLSAERARRHLHRFVETELRLRPTGD